MSDQKTEGLKLLRMKLKQGDYDGVDIMQARTVIDEPIELRKLVEDRAALLNIEPTTLYAFGEGTIEACGDILAFERVPAKGERR